jgi:S1-C subfamily serine protease
VYRGSSADNAGIRGANEIALLYNQRFLIGGDIITEIEGKPVASMDELQLALEARKPGETVRVTVYRGQSKVQKQVPLVEAPRQRRNLL